MIGRLNWRGAIASLFAAIRRSMRSLENHVPIEKPKHTMAIHRVMRRATRRRRKIGIQVPHAAADDCLPRRENMSCEEI